jgi:hypothetical protein
VFSLDVGKVTPERIFYHPRDGDSCAFLERLEFLLEVYWNGDLELDSHP